MKGVLVAAHGSRAKETEATLTAVVDTLGKKLPGVPVEYAFMEFSDKTIEGGIAALVEKGVTEIRVAPYFLFMGIHLKEDIPDMVNACLEKYPGVRASIAEPLGIDGRLADILLERIGTLL